MKKLLFIIVLFCLIKTKAQTNKYHPFPTDSNAIWRVNQTAYPTATCSFYQYTLGADTIINSLSGKKLYKSGWFNSNNCPQAPNSAFGGVYSYTCVGALTQDSVNKKVYYNGTLLYDFTKVVGDTLVTNSQNTVTISSIDSVLVGNNYHKRFNTAGTGYLNSAVIEGVGATSGLLEYLFNSEYPSSLVCFNNNADTYPSNGTCSQITIGISTFTVQSSAIKIYPNPANNKITIKATDVIDVKLFDVIGKQITSTKENQLDAGNLNNGVYFIQVQTKQSTTIQKIVVQH